jgi:hypothetical protein
VNVGESPLGTRRRRLLGRGAQSAVHRERQCTRLRINGGAHSRKSLVTQPLNDSATEDQSRMTNDDTERGPASGEAPGSGRTPPVTTGRRLRREYRYRRRQENLHRTRDEDARDSPHPSVFRAQCSALRVPCSALHCWIVVRRVPDFLTASCSAFVPDEKSLESKTHPTNRTTACFTARAWSPHVPILTSGSIAVGAEGYHRQERRRQHGSPPRPALACRQDHLSMRGRPAATEYDSTDQ